MYKKILIILGVILLIIILLFIGNYANNQKYKHCIYPTKFIYNDTLYNHLEDLPKNINPRNIEVVKIQVCNDHSDYEKELETYYEP
jgi:hypothetical protein